MPMSWFKRVTFLGAAAVALAAGACNESTAPSAVDPTAMATAVTTLNTSFSQNAVFQSLVALDGSAALGVAVVRAAVPVVPGKPWTASAAGTRAALSALAARAPTAIQALFPANVLGKTFQWDTTSPAEYRITDSTLGGAPSNGVRFLLYQIDTATLKPSVPLQPTGYVDLADISTAQANVLHLLLRVGNQTAADYTVTEVKTTTSLSLSAVGYLTNVVVSGPTVNFNLSHVLSLADSSLSTNYQADDGSATVSLVSTVSGSGGTPSLTMDWTVTKGGSVEIVGTSADTINIRFKFNGTTVATVTGASSNPSLTTPAGQSLTGAQLLALNEILDGFAAIYYNLSLLFVPGILVFG
jgi:hypothetical protein